MKNPLPIFVVLALGSCSKTPEAQPAAAGPLGAVAVAIGTVDAEAGLVRVLAPRDGVLLSPLVAEGDHVTTSQSLVRIDDQQARLTLEVAEADAADRAAQAAVAATRSAGAIREAERLGRLARADAATRVEADLAATNAAVAAGEQRQASAARRAAEARRALSAYDVTVRDVRAPVSGRVVRRTAAGGAFVAAASPLFVIEPDGRRVVRAELDEAFADQVRPGMRATVTGEFQSGAGFQATVLRVSNLLAAPTLADDAASRIDGRVLTVTLDVPRDATFRIGQKVLVRFSR